MPEYTMKGKNRKKRIFAFLILAIVILGLVTCASTDAVKTQPADFEGQSWTKINTATITGDTTGARTRRSQSSVYLFSFVPSLSNQLSR